MEIKRPTFLVNKDICRKNIERIKTKAEKTNTELQAHFKTHQSLETGELFLESGINKITVSSVQMAQEFSQNPNYKEITIAFPLNILEIEEINELAKKIKLTILIESSEAAKIASSKIKNNISYLIEIDTAYNRTGVWHENTDEIDLILAVLSKNEKFTFKGFMSHDGQNYTADNEKAIIENHNSSKFKLMTLKSKYNTSFSMGDTPSCSLVHDFSGIDIVRPGNFVYYDLMQVKAGSCNIENIAVTVACPVVSIHNERNEVIIYGGAVHLSKEYIICADGQKVFGIPVIYDKGFKTYTQIENARVKSLSQEHGIIKFESKIPVEIKIGQIIGILPVHSCLAANLLRTSSLII